jgi:hypothetical protein
VVKGIAPECVMEVDSPILMAPSSRTR